MTRVCDMMMTFCFTYFFIYVFKKIEGDTNSNKNLEIKYIFLISMIDILLSYMLIKPIKLGIYYILLEIFIYRIYTKDKHNFFMAYILTFWIYQISDIIAGLLLYKNAILGDFLSSNICFNTIIFQFLIICIAILLANLILKLNSINKFETIKENKLLFIHTNIIIVVYMVFIYYYNNTKNTESIIVTSIIVLCFFLFISYFMFMILNKLYIEKNQRNHVEMYNSIIEESLDNMKVYKHDQKNILLSIGGFLDNNDIEGLKTYFYKNIANNEFIQNKNLYGLVNIRNSPVKGLMYGKISNAIFKEINLNINITNPIDDFKIKDIDICKILGILIDNAIESSVKSYDKILNIGISNDDSEIYIIISNSFKDKPILHKIFEKGYSTKGDNRGLGLNIVRELNEKKYPNMCISAKIKDNLFNIEIIIKK